MLDGCLIERRDELEGVRLSWPLPAPGGGRYVMAALAAPFLGVWLAGIAAVIHRLLTGGDILLLGWLAGWFVCGLWLPLGFWLLVRPNRPESVRLGDATFEHDEGRSVASPAYLTGLLMGTWPVSPRKPVRVPRSEVAFALDDHGARHRLTFETDGRPVEIGASLRDEDRQWLFAVLEAWRRG